MAKRSQKTLNRVKSVKFDLDARKQNTKEASRVLSLTKALLVIIGDMGTATVQSFWPHPYYHVFCEHRERSVQTTLSRLQKQGLVDKKKDGGKFFVLTQNGEKERDIALKRM